MNTALKLRKLEPYDDSWEETTGVHQMSVDLIKRNRASISELILELKAIKNEMESIVESKDIVLTESEPTAKGDS